MHTKDFDICVEASRPAAILRRARRRTEMEGLATLDRFLQRPTDAAVAASRRVLCAG